MCGTSVIIYIVNLPCILIHISRSVDIIVCTVVTSFMHAHCVPPCMAGPTTKEESLLQLVQPLWSNHWIILTLALVVVDKFSETRLVIEFWSDNFAYAIAFAGTMAFSVLLNLVLIGRFVMRHRSDNAFKLHLHTRRSTVSVVFMLSLLKFDLMKV